MNISESLQTVKQRRQRSGTFTWCPARRCRLRTQILESGPTHPACVMGGAQPPFSTTGAAHPAQQLRLLLLWAGDVEVIQGPVCSGCTGTIRVGSHPIICTQCHRFFHGYCNGLTRDQQRATFAALAAARMAPPSNPRRLRGLNPITPSSAKRASQ